MDKVNLATSKYVILCSSRKTETSRGGECSLATKYWELGCGWNPKKGKKYALKADKNNDKKITINELYNYAYPKVLKQKENQHIVKYSEKDNYVIFGRFNR